MSEWIICTHCKNIVPNYGNCDTCNCKLPKIITTISDNTCDKICKTCQEVAELDSEYCWLCGEIYFND